MGKILYPVGTMVEVVKTHIVDPDKHVGHGRKGLIGRVIAYRKGSPYPYQLDNSQFVRFNVKELKRYTPTDSKKIPVKDSVEKSGEQCQCMTEDQLADAVELALVRVLSKLVA